MSIFLVFKAFYQEIFLCIDGETKTEESARSQGGPSASRAESGPETEESQEGSKTLKTVCYLYGLFQINLERNGISQLVFLLSSENTCSSIL